MGKASTLSSLFDSNYLGMKNILINGDFRIWQKGTDLNPASVGNQVTTVDRWTTQYADFSPRIRKIEDTISGQTVDTMEITKLSGTFASCEITQKVETNVAKYLRGQQVTFSFWIKKIGSTFGSHATQFWLGDSETVDDPGWTNPRTSDRGRSSGVTGTSTTVTFANNNWVKYSITRTLSSDTNTIYCTIYTINTPTSEGIRIARCQLECGSISTPFEIRPIALETSLCQRYFEQVESGEIPEASTYYAGWKYLNPVRFAETKRATPTITVTSQGGWPNGSGGGYGVSSNPQYVAFSGQSGNAVNNNLHTYSCFANAEI
ncbi:hypothetical protein UFOVP767_34 [uncultured Caudovirales phage]|uniref:Uncharacterized protein n=1 Tax=uncultured Caudovirales phage TaxID=2100421 RepID=A0A6J5NPI4_9CAUD|nr:hypothetical protein UFOVP767_34 [uncultured Caudovirales phage]